MGQRQVSVGASNHHQKVEFSLYENLRANADKCKISGTAFSPLSGGKGHTCICLGSVHLGAGFSAENICWAVRRDVLGNDADWRQKMLWDIWLACLIGRAERLVR